MRQELRADDAAKAQIDRSRQGDDAPRKRQPNDARTAQRNRLRYCSARNSITRLRRSRTPLRKNVAASTGAMRIENVMAPRRAKATVQAMGRNNRPSTRCSVKIGR